MLDSQKLNLMFLTTLRRITQWVGLRSPHIHRPTAPASVTYVSAELCNSCCIKIGSIRLIKNINSCLLGELQSHSNASANHNGQELICLLYHPRWKEYRQLGWYQMCVPASTSLSTPANPNTQTVEESPTVGKIRLYLYVIHNQKLFNYYRSVSVYSEHNMISGDTIPNTSFTKWPTRCAGFGKFISMDRIRLSWRSYRYAATTTPSDTKFTK